jgi:hypothetical protein
MNKAFKRLFFAFFMMALPCVALSQPTVGTLIGPGGDIINYECLPSGVSVSGSPGSRVTCDFVQVLLTQVLEPSDFEARMMENLAAVSSDQAWADELCSQFLEPIAAIVRRANGNALEETPDLVLPIEIADRAEFIQSFNLDREMHTNFFLAGEAFCQQRTDASAREFFAVGMTRETKTCRPMVVRYQQTFVMVSETLWAVESLPEPPCAIVNTSRFIASDDTGFFWDYVAEKRILNPEAEVSTGGLMCGDLDEEAYLYSWQTPPVRVDCEFMD